MNELAATEYRALVEDGPLALRRLDASGRCLYVNRRCLELTGAGAPELLGDGWAGLIHEDDRAAYQELLIVELAGGEAFEAEWRLRRADGSYGWVMERAAPLRDAAGRLDGYVSQLIDIDRRRQVEQARAVAMSFVAHEQRTPLMASRLLIELNRRRAAAGHPLDEALLDKLLQQHHRLDRLAADLSETARQELALPLRLQSAPMSLTALLEECGALQQLRLDEQNRAGCSHRLTLRLPTQSLWVHADRDRLVQVLANLLDNAIKYSPGGGEITLTAEAGASAHCIEVRDPGVGIPPDELSLVTRRFYRGSRAAGVPGSGLGLAISEALVRAQGGSLTIASTPGEGTVIRLTLPALPPPVA